MSSTHIQALLSPPDTEAANKRVLSLLDHQFQSLDDLANLESAVAESRAQSDDLNLKVGFQLGHLFLLDLLNGFSSALTISDKG